MTFERGRKAVRWSLTTTQLDFATASNIVHGVHDKPTLRTNLVRSSRRDCAIPIPVTPATAAAPSVAPSDPGLYAGDKSFSPWPSANGPSLSVPASDNIANAREVVAGMGVAFKRCYDRTLQDDPKVVGRAQLTAKVGPDGRVVSVTPSTVVGLPGNMVVCVMMVVNSAQFAPPNGGGATIVIPLSFISK